MDLLGSILGGMDNLPKKKVDEKTKKKIEEAKAKEEKFKEEQRKRKMEFRTQIEVKINEFLQGPSEERKIIWEPMDKVHRSIIHDVAETAGLISHSFGEEDIDRHLILWKKEYAPCEAELDALRNGEIYDANKVNSEVKLQDKEDREPLQRQNTKKINKEPEKYFEKYAKIVGKDSGLEAAAATQSNKSYGMVPSKNKADKRSIEETMKEIKDRKRAKQDMT